jgi:hypothetical protein
MEMQVMVEKTVLMLRHAEKTDDLEAQSLAKSLADAALLIHHTDDHAIPRRITFATIRRYDFAIFRLSGRERLAGRPVASAVA